MSLPVFTYGSIPYNRIIPASRDELTNLLRGLTPVGTSTDIYGKWLYDVYELTSSVCVIKGDNVPTKVYHARNIHYDSEAYELIRMYEFTEEGEDIINAGLKDIRTEFANKYAY